MTHCVWPVVACSSRWMTGSETLTAVLSMKRHRRAENRRDEHPRGSSSSRPFAPCSGLLPATENCRVVSSLLDRPLRAAILAAAGQRVRASRRHALRHASGRRAASSPARARRSSCRWRATPTRSGFAVAATILGESVRDRAETLAVTDEYCRLLRAFADEGIDANVAFKLTHVGLDIDPELAFENAIAHRRGGGGGRQHRSDGHGAVALRRSHARRSTGACASATRTSASCCSRISTEASDDLLAAAAARRRTCASSRARTSSRRPSLIRRKRDVDENYIELVELALSHERLHGHRDARSQDRRTRRSRLRVRTGCQARALRVSAALRHRDAARAQPRGARLSRAPVDPIRGVLVSVFDAPLGRTARERRRSSSRCARTAMITRHLVGGPDAGRRRLLRPTFAIATALLPRSLGARLRRNQPARHDRRGDVVQRRSARRVHGGGSFERPADGADDGREQAPHRSRDAVAPDALRVRMRFRRGARHAAVLFSRRVRRRHRRDSSTCCCRAANARRATACCSTTFRSMSGIAFHPGAGRSPVAGVSGYHRRHEGQLERSRSCRPRSYRAIPVWRFAGVGARSARGQVARRVGMHLGQRRALAASWRATSWRAVMRRRRDARTRARGAGRPSVHLGRPLRNGAAAARSIVGAPAATAAAAGCAAATRARPRARTVRVGATLTQRVRG